MACSPCGNNTPLVFNVQQYLNSSTACNTDGCLPSKNICYSGANLPCSGIDNGDTIDDALVKIDEILCANSGDYSTYQKGCLEAAYGEDITTEAQFVDAITEYICSINVTSNTFITNTFPTYQTTINNRFEVIETPAIACASAGIVVGDTLSDVYEKYCVKFTAIDETLDISDVDFGECFTITTPPTTVKTGFEEVLQQICQVKTIAESAEAGITLPTFNNIGSCLAGTLTTTDTLVDTVTKIRTKLCTLPTWDSTALTWGCVGAPTTDLGNGIQRILTKVNYMLPKTVTFGSGFVIAATDAGDPCAGVTVSLGTITDRLVAANNTDTTPSTLDNKLLGVGITVDSLVNTDKITLINDFKVKATSGDTVPSFLIDKLNGSSSNGISITPVYNSTTKKIDLNLSVDTSMFCAILAQCAGVVPCSGYTVTPAGSSSLTYTDCEGGLVNITISGVTNICAKLNTVYAPNATIVNTGACAPFNSPIFTLINNSVDIVVSDVVTGGLRFYTISSGDYPLYNGEFLSGVGNTSGIVTVMTTEGDGSAHLYKNEVLQETITISGGGSYPFTAVTYAAGDDLKVILTPYSMFAISNQVGDASDATITDVTDVTDSVFYTLTGGSPFPFEGLSLGSGFGTTSDAVKVSITYTGVPNKYVTLWKNSVAVETLVVTGSADYTFTPISFLPGDYMLITLSDTDPA